MDYVIASDGTQIPLSSVAKTYGYTGNNITSISITYRGNVYRKTLVYVSNLLTSESIYVKQ
jgi:hypothetical protein